MLSRPRHILQLIAIDELRRRRRRRHGGGTAAAASSTPTTYAYDTFDRADGALGTADSGQVWTLNSGAWVVTSNQAGMTGGTFVRNAVLDDSQADGVFQCTVNAGTSGGLVIRATASDTLLYLRQSAGFLRLFKATPPSTLTNIGSGGAPVAGDTFKIVAAGDTLDIYLNGVFLYTVTESQGDTWTQHGIGSQSGVDRIDDWSHASA